MRWFEPPDPPAPRNGEERTFRKFAFMPITFNGETRWFEIVPIVYKWNQTHRCWVALRFEK